MVRELRDLSAFNEVLLSVNGDKIAVVDFYADWCGPCKYIAPLFNVLDQKYKNAIFCKVNVDIARDIASTYGINAMPTFLILKNGREVERISGADPNRLENVIQKHHKDSAANPNAATLIERKFLESFVMYTTRATYYKDIVNKTLALSLMPAEKLREEAVDANGAVNNFLLAKALLEWFKNDFFKWLDTPICPICTKKADEKDILYGSPNAEESKRSAKKVEIVLCECGNEVRFPRLTNPSYLLETRVGRCGEWSYCFALMASALDFDFRLVYDVLDHVWVELWIPELDRWVHCDPSENSIDSPLLYEIGWKKKLSYVVAIGIDHIHDVTWRYVENNLETLKKRKAVREEVFANFMSKLNQRMRKDIDKTRAEELTRRRIRELVEFLVVGKKKCDEQYGGRTSGSESWRIQRGEVGASPKKRQQIVLRPNDKELSAGTMRISYDCNNDVYTRGEDKIKGWSSYVYKSKNITRKVESDWNVTYLCRKEGKEEGEVTWAIDLTGVKGKSAKLKILGTQTFENGEIHILTCAEDVCLPFPSSGELVINELPSSLLKITATLTGGSGNCAFQHAQLFRCSRDITADQLIIEIQFE